ncbi:MAG: hypothetical protein IPP68_07505 [Elusimicrobia bacterium]|nr:hypothetical protein [Elusimicrobiota bacterium]
MNTKLTLYLVLAIPIVAFARARENVKVEWEVYEDGLLNFSVRQPASWDREIHGGSMIIRPKNSSKGVRIDGQYYWKDLPNNGKECKKVQLPSVEAYECPGPDGYSQHVLYIDQPWGLIIDDQIKSKVSKEIVNSFRLQKLDSAQPGATPDANSGRR